LFFVISFELHPASLFGGGLFEVLKDKLDSFKISNKYRLKTSARVYKWRAGYNKFSSNDKLIVMSYFLSTSSFLTG
jgi:hypothetical protein